jgi:AcrR family transcriptional regulator
MTLPPASRRHHDAAGRRSQTRASRQRILRAATHLFHAHGYVATSMAQVAAEAGVPTPALLAAFKSKVDLLKEVVDAATAGDSEEFVPDEQPVHDAPTATEALRRYADTVAGVAHRTYPIYAVAHAAAGTDPQIAALVADLDRQRLTGAGYIATAVAAKRGDADLSRVGYLRDTIWALNSPELYDLLVHQRGWTVEAYRDWIATALTALAAPSPPARE